VVHDGIALCTTQFALAREHPVDGLRGDLET
jgi:hypothetical protein